MGISYSPRAAFLTLLEKWPELLLSALLGAAIGLLIARLLPTQYRAAASLSIDHNVAEAFNSQNDLDIAAYLNRETNRLEAYAYSDQIWGQIEASLVSDGWENQTRSFEDLRSAAVLPHSQDGAWAFLAITPDRQFSEALASAWASTFFENVSLSIRSADEKQQLLDLLASQNDQISGKGLECADLQSLQAEIDGILERLETRSSFSAVIQNQIDRVSLGFLSYASNAESLDAQIDLANKLRDSLQTESRLCTTALETLQSERASNERLVGELENASSGISPYLEVRLVRDAQDSGRASANDGRFMIWGAFLVMAGWFVFRLFRSRSTLAEHEKENKS